MAWTTPKTWAPGDPLVASELNTHIRDNLDALKNPPTTVFDPTSSNYTTTSSSFEDVHTTDWKLLSLDTNGGPLLICLNSVVYLDTGGTGETVNAHFDVEVDGNRIGDGDDGITYGRVSLQARAVSFNYLLQGIAAGSHDFILQWKSVTEATHPLTLVGKTTQFWVREVS